MCGEKAVGLDHQVDILGSPPRMRGKDHGLQHIAPDAGITPACAGKSQLVKAFQRRSWDHPRVCGEKKPAPSGLDSQQGSPPRVRGKGTSSASTTALFRITPAYAGKSNMIFLRQHVRKDHPRVCGEKHPSTAIRQRNTGSPSRMRGKAVHHKHRHSPGRITPACAGKSVRRENSSS